MPQGRESDRQLKVAAKTGKYVVGRREVSGSIKGSKLLVWSSSANVPQSILDQCRELTVPAFKFEGNPVELGRACGIPFRVSVIALKAAGDADLSGFSSAADYTSALGNESEARRVEEIAQKEEKAVEKPVRRTRKKQEKLADEPKEKTEEASSETEKPKKRTRKTKSKKEEQ